MNRGRCGTCFCNSLMFHKKLLAANCGTLGNVIPETVENKGKLLAAFWDKPRRRYTPCKGGCTCTTALQTTSAMGEVGNPDVEMRRSR